MRSTTEHVECGGCGQVLLGEALKVSPNLHYHIQCFLCCTCDCELVNTGFFTKLAKYYCAEDYHSEFGTQCALCNRFIEGEGLSVQGRSYHMSCLRCYKCNAQFDGGSRITFEREKPMCDDCKQYEKKCTDAPVICHGCGKVIVGTSIFAIDKDWHMECFRCNKCEKSLSGEYMCKDGIPYCEEDYQALYGQSCNICSEYIIGKVLQAGGSSYHTSCLKCYICTKQFEEGQEIFMQDELFWHTECDDGAPEGAPDAAPPAPAEPPSAPVEPPSALTSNHEPAPEKSPPELILPPPPSATPPPDTPPANTLPNLTKQNRTPKTSESVSANEQGYVLVDPVEKIANGGSSVEDITEKSEVSNKASSKSSKKSAKSKKSSLTPESKHLEQSRSNSSIVSDYEELVIPAKPNNVTITNDNEVENAIVANKPIALVTQVSIDTAQEATKHTFSDKSATILIDDTVKRPLQNNGIISLNDSKNSNSDSSSYQSDKENHHIEVTDNAELVVAEKCKSVSEVIKIAQDKEQAVKDEHPSLQSNKKSFSLSKKFITTPIDDGADDLLRKDRNSSESDTAPSKPPRKKSPERDVETTPSAVVRGLRSVDSPVLRLLEDIENKKQDEIDYLPLTATYTLDQLKTEKIRLPKEIDRSRLQDYLTPEDFLKTFKMDNATFNSMPAWKKNNAKKSANLF